MWLGLGLTANSTSQPCRPLTVPVRQVSEGLLALGFPRVCTLHRGVDALREAGALQVPSC